ncbi:unnamed protein product [Phytomonas sp. Hart1]|nr:unnamed protein product [Phytomonas sp. Hart1]|eukprot:CCW68476.1 unnamed protein product [Phytomonas sp. isolate Hart1]
MSCFFLKQLDSKSEDDKILLDLFQNCRERVVNVASIHYLPNHIVVTTKNGFIEFVDVSKGEFRLFLTHLEHHIPLDASVRCISLVPRHFFIHPNPNVRDLDRSETQLLYSLAFSNELLLANLETGMVNVLDRFDTRPSALFCDESYVVCGEGGGQVSVWGLNHAMQALNSVVAHPNLLWKKKLVEDTLVCVRVHQKQLICYSADHHVCILLVDTGECLKTWICELDPVVDILFVKDTLTQLLATVICLHTCISIYTETESVSSNHTTQERAIQQSQGKWRLNRRFTLDNAIQCATCFGNYLVAGTASGVVLLYYLANLEDGLRELARFDVGYGVVRVQLYANETLVVVSSKGDIWKWPLADLINECDKSNSPRASEIPSLQGEDPFKPADAPAVLNSTLADESQDTFRNRAETLPGEGCREGSVCLEDDYQFEDSYGEEIHEEEEQQRQPSLPSTSIANSRRSKQSEVFKAHDEISEVYQKSVSQTTRSPSVQNLNSTSTVNSTKMQSRAISLPLERAADNKEPLTLVEERLQDRTHDMKFASTSPQSIASGPEDSMTNKKYAVHQDGPATVIACSSSRGTSDCHESDERDGNAASVAVTTEPEVVAVEEGNLLDTSVDTIYSSLSPRSTRPPMPIPVERNPYEEYAVTANESQMPENQITISSKGSTPQKQVFSHIDGYHDTFSRNNAMVRVNHNALVHNYSQYSPERELNNLQTILGPLEAISGLRKGRLMDPRQIHQILETESVNRESENESDDEITHRNLQSTTMVLEFKDTPQKKAFNFESYLKEHPLEAEALLYHYPVKLPTYSLADRVFDDAMPPIIDSRNGYSLKIKNNGSTEDTATVRVGNAGWPSLKPTAGADEYTDDLMDATHYRFTRKMDPDLIEERRRGGPDINAHPCDDILYPTSDPSLTVLFKEHPMQPSEPFALLLPMPLPPTPSVF